MRRYAPLFGLSISLVVLILAAGRYPGGYDWVDQSVSSLFQPTALNGELNAARFLSATAVVIFCVSMATVFAAISKSGPTRIHRKTVQIAGIGSMVYAALVVTPMHDVLIGVALLFFVTAMLALFHGLYLQRRRWMLLSGLACLAVVLGNATMYYGNLLYGFLPVVQKLSIVLWVSWLFCLYFAKSRASADPPPFTSG